MKQQLRALSEELVSRLDELQPAMVEHIAASEIPESEIKELSQLFVDAQDRAQRLEQKVRKDAFDTIAARPELMQKPRLTVVSAATLTTNL